MYRHVASSASFALSKELLMQVRVLSRFSLGAVHFFLCDGLDLQVRADAFQSIVLPQRGWEKFSIWGCGRDGKRFFNLLSRENKHKVRVFFLRSLVCLCEFSMTRRMQVIMFVDVAEDKIARAAYNHGVTGLKPTPVLHFSKVQLPVVRMVFSVHFHSDPAA